MPLSCRSKVRGAASQKGGEPSFAEALVNGEVAPTPDLPALAPERGDPDPKRSRLPIVDLRR
jgi:hypothetical protein